MSTRNKNLLPCPFCGGAPELVEVEPKGYVVECTYGPCGASTNIRYSVMEDARPLVAVQWNRRAPHRKAKKTKQADATRPHNPEDCL